MKLRHKFNARKASRNGHGFQSRREARYFDKLMLAKQAGELVMFLRQPRFDLPGGVTYRADFLEFWADGTCRVIDVKGHKTAEYIARKKMVEALYPVTIEEIK